jgi:hypothetical protein
VATGDTPVCMRTVMGKFVKQRRLKRIMTSHLTRPTAQLFERYYDSTWSTRVMTRLRMTSSYITDGAQKYFRGFCTVTCAQYSTGTIGNTTRPRSTTSLYLVDQHRPRHSRHYGVGAKYGYYWLHGKDGTHVCNCRAVFGAAHRQWRDGHLGT